jgi:hypothetical protein
MCATAVRYHRRRRLLDLAGVALLVPASRSRPVRERDPLLRGCVRAKVTCPPGGSSENASPESMAALCFCPLGDVRVEAGPHATEGGLQGRPRGNPSRVRFSRPLGDEDLQRPGARASLPATSMPNPTTNSSGDLVRPTHSRSTRTTRREGLLSSVATLTSVAPSSRRPRDEPLESCAPCRRCPRSARRRLLATGGGWPVTATLPLLVVASP